METAWIQERENKMLQLGLTQLWQIEKAMRENRYTVEMFHRMFQKDFFPSGKISSLRYRNHRACLSV
jgi:hypothetical protein